LQILRQKVEYIKINNIERNMHIKRIKGMRRERKAQIEIVRILWKKREKGKIEVSSLYLDNRKKRDNLITNLI